VQNTLRWNCVSLQISQNRAGGIPTQICGNNFMVLKVAPPLIVSEQQLEEFVVAICSVAELMHGGGGFWSEALGVAL
jgi:ornithine--oxo-acid transaminase